MTDKQFENTLRVQAQRCESDLRRLAQNRAKRMATGRPVIDLTDDEAEASSRAAMRLAGADPQPRSAHQPKENSMTDEGSCCSVPIVRGTKDERVAYGQGFEAGARLILKHWRGNLSVDKSEELLASLLTLFPMIHRYERREG